MKLHHLLLLTAAAGLAFTSCKKDEDEPATATTGGSGSATTRNFVVTVENIASPQMHFASGIFNTPVGMTMPGGAGPGGSYEFTFAATPGQKLNFATMYVGSNDLFFGPDGAGIDLFPGGVARHGDVTAEVQLWDAGTEVNEMPGSGANQPMNQAGPNTGADEMGTVRDISAVMDGFTYPSVASTIQVNIDSLGNNEFRCTIMNLMGSPTPIAPGVWVVHSDADPLFTDNSADMMQGLEALAEDGDPAMLGGYLAMNSGIASPFAPGVWAVHGSDVEAIFTNGAPDNGMGLEALAEDGDPAALGTALTSLTGVSASGVFNTPTGASMPGPIGPGASYEFTFTASQGDHLSLATMFVFSNDGFVAPGQNGLALWNGSTVLSGDITSMMDLWDAGTEVNQFPGAGPHQPAIGGPNNGASEVQNVQLTSATGDGYTYPAVADMIRITITPQ